MVPSNFSRLKMLGRQSTDNVPKDMPWLQQLASTDIRVSKPRTEACREQAHPRRYDHRNAATVGNCAQCRHRMWQLPRTAPVQPAEAGDGATAACRLLCYFFVAFQTPYAPPFHEWTPSDRAVIRAMGRDDMSYRVMMCSSHYEYAQLVSFCGSENGATGAAALRRRLLAQCKRHGRTCAHLTMADSDRFLSIRRESIFCLEPPGKYKPQASHLAFQRYVGALHPRPARQCRQGAVQAKARVRVDANPRVRVDTNPRVRVYSGYGPMRRSAMDLSCSVAFPSSS